jgi:hypothetical protein
MINETNMPDEFGSNPASWSTDGDEWDDAGYISYSKESKSTLFSSGEYVILGNSQPYLNVLAITGVKETITDSGVGTIFKKEFRYSIDSTTFSEFQELTTEALVELGSFDRIWFQFRYILLSGGPATITEITIVYTEQPKSYEGYITPNIKDETRVYAFPITYKSNFLWDPYKMNRAVRLYKDLNLMVNNLFGHDASYYRVLPQGRSKDVFLMEYSLYEHDDQKCVKVVVPNNEFPDNKLNMGPFGVDFEMPFEVHIDKDYFQKIFGDGSGPQKRDVIYFPRTSRIYEVSSSYLFRDFMNEPLYFKVTLIKWLPKTNVEQSETVNTLESFTNSAGKLFGDIIKDEEIKITNPEQFTVATTIKDPVRSYLFQDQEIGTENVLNYYTVIAEHFYKMESSLSLKKIKTKIDATHLEKNVTYFVRVSSSSVQSDVQMYYSMMKLTYLGQDEGYTIFSYEAGISQMASLYPLGTLIAPGSQFLLYKDEYSGTVTEDFEASCDSSHVNYYKTKIVKYHAKNDFPLTEDRAFSCWFNLKENNNAKIRLVSVDLDVYSNEVTFELNRPFQFLVGDTVTLSKTSGGNFYIYGEVSQVVSSTIIRMTVDQEILDYVKVNFNSWSLYTDLIAQKSFSRIFLNSLHNGKGIKIELYENRHFKITMNDKYQYFSIPNDKAAIENKVWHGLFINFGNMFKQLTLNVWKMQWNPVDKIPATTDLRLIYNKTVPFAREDRSSDMQYFLEPSFMDLTNIRLFNKVAETDKQVLILNQNIVKDAHLAIIIDNALPQSNMPYFGYTR